MATDTLSIARDSAKPRTIDDLATIVQAETRRVISLAHAIDDAIDFCAGENAERIGRAIDYLNLLREAAEKAGAAGEELEVVAMEARRGQ